MEAECFSGSCPQKFPQKFRKLSNESLQQLSFEKKGKLFATFYNFQSRCKKTVTLLFVGSHVHRDTKFW